MEMIAMAITYKRFFDMYINSFRADPKHHEELLQSIENYLKDEMKIFYPKNFFNSKDSEVIVFSDTKIFVLHFADDVRIDIESYELNIKKIDFKTPDRYMLKARLIVEPQDGPKLEFDSIDDSDAQTSWPSEYREAIETIYKFLIKK
jgi:hypothetical protein